MPTPWTVLSPLAAVAEAPKHRLVAVSRDVEGVALATPGAEVHATLQRVEHLTALTELVYVRLARRGVPVHVHGVGVSGRRDLADLLHLHDLAPDSPLVAEWSVLMTSGDYCTAMAAVETAAGEDLPDPQRRFDWVGSTDGDAIRAAVGTLVRR